jgi:hypothetical protein
MFVTPDGRSGGGVTGDSLDVSAVDADVTSLKSTDEAPSLGSVESPESEALLDVVVLELESCDEVALTAGGGVATPVEVVAGALVALVLLARLEVEDAPRVLELGNGSVESGDGSGAASEQ